MKARNKDLLETLLLVGAGKRNSAYAEKKIGKYMVVGDLMLRNFGAEHTNSIVECFQGIKTEQLHRVIGKMHLGSAENVIIHMGTNDLRATRNLDFVLGEVYAMVATAKRKFLTAHLS
jgi:hypothetical protein